jgi:predicted Zn finger-like uncharacterized protein
VYTECPDCRTAFRLTARILKQAHGRVRCGGCGSTFNAIDHLSEDLPDDSTGNTTTAHIFDERSRRLLESLDQLTGPGELRIEDTGVEWRVLDVDDDAESGAQNAENDPLPDSSPTGTIQWSLEEADTPEEDVVDAARPGEPPPSGDRRKAPPPAFVDEEDTPMDAPAWQLTEDSGEESTLQAADAAVDSEAAADPADAAEAAEPAVQVATPAATELAQEPEPPAKAAGNEVRYDDNTPLPDEFFRPYDEFLKNRPNDAQAPADESAATDGNATTADTPANGQADLEFGEADDWQELLAEVGSDEDAAPPAEPATADDGADTTVQAHDEETANVDPAATGGGLLDRALAAASTIAKEVTGAHKQAASAPEDDTAVHDLAGDESSDDAAETADSDVSDTAPAADPVPEEAAAAETSVDAEADERIAADDAADADADDIVAADTDPAPEESIAAGAPPEPDGEAVDIDDELSVEMEIDQELLRAVAEQAGEPPAGKPASPAAGDSMLVETIIMEGDTVTDLLMEAEAAEASGILPADALDAPANESATSEADDTRPRRTYAAIAATVLLVLLLTAQLVHANRERLATWDVFNTTVGPVYEALGHPVTPAWDVRSWRFEATSGSTDDSGQRLTIRSRIANKSEQAMPYPLVYVSLTDRFEELVGSRVLEPREYLVTGNSRRPVPAGANFTAVINVDTPSPDATGFKLNVCYRVAAGQLRCAIEDFKN